MVALDQGGGSDAYSMQPLMHDQPQPACGRPEVRSRDVHERLLWIGGQIVESKTPAGGSRLRAASKPGHNKGARSARPPWVQADELRVVPRCDSDAKKKAAPFPVPQVGEEQRGQVSPRRPLTC